MQDYAKMTKRPITQVKIEALTMFLQGITLENIAKELKKHRNTITNWKTKYRWEDRKKDMEDREVKLQSESNIERKRRLLKLATAIQGKFVTELATAEIKPTDAIKAMEFEAKISGLDILRIENISGISDQEAIKAAQEAKEEDDKK